MTIKEQLLSAVDLTPLDKEPYDHFYMGSVFSATNYQKLLFSLPKKDLYEQFLHPDAKVSEYESTRLRFPLVKENLDKLEDKEFWTELTEACCSRELQAAVFKKLKGDLETRFKMPIDKIPASPSVFLFKDITGYKISPHPDSPKKAVTFQLYLPENWDNEDVGTIVYTKEKQGFNKFKQFKFHPNTGYGFAVSRKSWHGVEPVGKPGLERNTLMIIYYLDNPNDSKKYPL
jgi:hypothetical protein